MPATPAPSPRARVGLVGLSGYADAILKLLRAEDADPAGRTRLAAVFAPDADRHGETLAALAADGVRAHGSYAALLDDPAVDAVWLPVPIALHRTMAEAALSAGKLVMLEKPVAGCVDDHDAIADAERAAGGGRVLVGFQDAYRASTLALKRRLLSGEWGSPRAASVWGLWPRPDAYYRRNGWAGALRRDGAWVLDSPLSNAMAHYVNLALLLLGGSEAGAAAVASVEAGLWRGRPGVENFDTCSLRAGLTGVAGGGACDLVVTLSHATDASVNPSVEVDAERGTLRVEFDGRATFAPAGGGAARLCGPEDGRPAMARALGALAAGESPRPAATLASSRPHTVLVSASQQAAAVVPVNAGRVDVGRVGDGDAAVHAIPGLPEAARLAAASRRTLGEAGFLPDGGVGRVDGLRDYRHFAGPRGG